MYPLVAGPENAKHNTVMSERCVEARARVQPGLLRAVLAHARARAAQEIDRPVGSPASPLSVLLLADDTSAHANTILEHIDALTRLSRHEVVTYNPRALRGSVALDLDEFDAIVIHYSLVTINDGYLAPAFRAKIRRFDGLKVQIIQDDYRWVEEFWAMMRELGVKVLFTLVPEREIERVWPSAELPGVERITTLAGYVPLDAGTQRVPSLAQPPVRHRVPRPRAAVLDRPPRPGEGVDRAGRGRARGALRATLRRRLARRRTHLRPELAGVHELRPSDAGLRERRVDHRLRRLVERGVRAYLERHPDASYDDVHRDVLAPYEGNVMMNVISPRVFEAIALRTALVLFPGEYVGILEPERHYIPLEKDFSNFDEVVERLRDLPALERMADVAFDEIIGSEPLLDRAVRRALRPGARRTWRAACAQAATGALSRRPSRTPTPAAGRARRRSSQPRRPRRSSAGE